MNVAHIPLQDILDSGLYTLHPFLGKNYISPELQASILYAGILSPPILQQNDDGSYEIVSGRQRLRCAKNVLSLHSCLCRVLPKTSVPKEILAIIIEDQHCRRELTLMEQACFLALCHSLLGEKQIEPFLRSLPQGRITKGSRFLLSLNALAPSIQAGLHSGMISEKITSDLQRLEENEQLQFAQLIENLQLSGNNQKKALAQIIDVTKGKGMTLDALLSRQDLDAILRDMHLTGPQRSARFMELLSQESQPLLHGASQAFEQEVKRLKLPDHCVLTPSTSFERDEVFLSIRFGNLQELKEKWPILQRHFTEED